MITRVIKAEVCDNYCNDKYCDKRGHLPNPSPSISAFKFMLCSYVIYVDGGSSQWSK